MDHNYIQIYNHEVNGKNLVYPTLFNLVITLAQIIGEIISGSLALISDKLHNFSDVLSLGFSLYANKLSRRKASLDQTFGYKRAELIAAFINAITLITVAFILIYEASSRLFHPEPVKSSLVIWLALLGIVVNCGSVLLLKNDSEYNLNMKSAYLYLLTNMMASVAVLVGGLLMKFYSWFWIDSVMTLLIPFYLIYISHDLIKSATKMLMLSTPDFIYIKKLVREVHKINGVNKLHHIHVWHLNDEELHLKGRLDCLDYIKMSEFNGLLHQIEHVLFEKFNIIHINIQHEFNKEDPKGFIVQD